MRPFRRSNWTGRRWTTVLSLAAILLAALSVGVEGQTGWVVAGRIVDARSGAVVSNALVTLEGHGAVVSSNRGIFRLERVPSSTYSLRVQALGYQNFAASVVVRADTLVVLAL